MLEFYYIFKIPVECAKGTYSLHPAKLPCTIYNRYMLDIKDVTIKLILST